jgi:hypothetical protein
MAAEVRVWNPYPRKKKTLTRDQVEARQDKAVRFLRDVAEDPDLADEIEDLSVGEYAERKGFELINNPTKHRKDRPMKKAEIQEMVNSAADIAAAKAVKQLRRSNPNGVQQATQTSSASTKVKSDQQMIIDRVNDAAAAIADDDPDEALDILNGLLDDYDEDDDAS